MISQNLKRFRASKGMTQKQLAKVSKVSEQQISRYEKGLMHPNASVLKRLADALEVSISLLEGETLKSNSIALDGATKEKLMTVFDSFISEPLSDIDILTAINTMEAWSLQNRVKRMKTM